jgi:protein SHQ1
LTLPGDVIEDDDTSAKYEISSGILSIALTKVNKGEHFPDLDLTNRLLARTGEVVNTTDSSTQKGPPRIQVMQSTDPLDDEDLEAALKYDFEVPQIPIEDEVLTGGKYGFNAQYSGHFRHLQNIDLVTLSPEEIEGLTGVERWTLGRKKEDEKFDREWYLADLLEPPEDLIEGMKFQVPDMQQPFTAEEQDTPRNLGTKDCITLLWTPLME